MEHLYLRCKHIYIYICGLHINGYIYIHSNTLDSFPLHVLKRSYMSSKQKLQGVEVSQGSIVWFQFGDVKKSRQHRVVMLAKPKSYKLLG